MKNKSSLFLTSLIGACALCCIGPILALLGLSSLSAVLIKYDYLILGGIILAGAATYFFIKKRKGLLVL